MDKTTINAYNQTAQEYEDQTSDFWDRFPRTFLDEFLNLGKGKILDLGSGPGRDALIFKQEGNDVVCLDASNEMLKLCKEKGLQTIEGDFAKLPFEPETFDGVWAYTSLLHVPKKDLPKILSQIHTVLKPDSVLALGMIEGTEEMYKEKEGEGKRWFSYYSNKELVDMLEEAGFQIIFQEEFKPGARRYLNIISMKLG